MTTESVRWARELEADLDEYPEERGEILIEAAGSWQRAGEHERAIELLTQAIAIGGEDGGNAQVALADVLFDLDRADEAYARLEALREQRPDSAAPYHLAAELLEHRGDFQRGLTWINTAVSRLTDDELAQQRDEEIGLFSFANNVLVARRRIRRALEQPADELDDSVQEFEGSALDKLLSGRRGRAGSPREVRVLFWPRGEVPRAHEQWPGLVEHADVEAIVREREEGNRELAATGVARITMVPLTAARLTEFAARTGSDPADQDTRFACMDEIVDEGTTINWPPGRNTPCWCDSGVKYKKCCGRPNLN